MTRLLRRVTHPNKNRERLKKKEKKKTKVHSVDLPRQPWGSWL